MPLPEGLGIDVTRFGRAIRPVRQRNVVFVLPIKSFIADLDFQPEHGAFPAAINRGCRWAYRRGTEIGQRAGMNFANRAIHGCRRAGDRASRHCSRKSGGLSAELAPVGTPAEFP